MFKKVVVGENSPIFTAEMRCYVVARDAGKYLRWCLGSGEKVCKMFDFSIARRERNKGKEQATDVFLGSYTSKREDMSFNSSIPSREKDGEYVEASYDTGYFTEVRVLAGTRSGRPLTKEERGEFAKQIEEDFCLSADLCGVSSYDFNQQLGSFILLTSVSRLG